MGEAKQKLMLSGAAAMALATQASRPGLVIRAERCENCKWGIENAPGLPPDAVQCHGGPPVSQAIFSPPDAEGQVRQIGMVTAFPAMRKADPMSFCGIWKPRIALTP